MKARLSLLAVDSLRGPTIWKLEIEDQSWLSSIDRNWLLTTHERSPGNRAMVQSRSI
jgi:hypothetical protein